MSKVLITGMTAPHASSDANRRSLSFAGAIRLVLESQGHIVDQIDPEVSWNTKDLDIYDSVLVGISPLTSLSANRIYGALSVIDVLLDTDKLLLFFDSPDPIRITSSVRAMIKTPDNLTKPFYSYRKGFNNASQPNMLQNLIDVVEHLGNEKWPTTLFPSLPWTNVDKVAAQLPSNAPDNLVSINLDSYLISTQDTLDVERREKWVVENYGTSWIKSTAATLEAPTVPMKWHKGWSDEQVQQQIAKGIGALISPHSQGTWWSYRFAQCLSALTPIATDWRESGLLGSDWSNLASRIEGMTPDERNLLAREQRNTYIDAVPSRRDAAISLTDALQLHVRKG